MKESGCSRHWRHEGFRDILYQTSTSTEDVPPIRSLLGYPGYTEGWATFVELHSYIYSGLSKDAAKLCAANQAAILSLYATADMGIHYEGWTLDDTAAFFSTYGFTDEEVLRDIFELIVSEPANYLKYYIGYLEFHDLQEEMKKQNPDTYTDSAFYEKVLKIGRHHSMCCGIMCWRTSNFRLPFLQTFHNCKKYRHYHGGCRDPCSLICKTYCGISKFRNDKDRHQTTGKKFT